MKFVFRLSFPDGSLLTISARIRGLFEDVEFAFKEPSKFLAIDLDQIIKAFKGFEAMLLPSISLTSR